VPFYLGYCYHICLASLASQQESGDCAVEGIVSNLG
jgi:hypothetical protein